MDRETLIAILAALAGGAVAGAAAGAVASVTITRKMLADKENGRYAKVIKLQQKLFATGESFRKARAENGQLNPWRRGGDRYANPKTNALFIRLNKEADALLRYAMDNFSGPQTDEAHYQVDDLFAGCIKIDTLTVEGLKQFLDVVVPIAIAKHMLSVEKLPLDTLRMVEFDNFAIRYKEIILSTKRRSLADRVRMYPEWAEKNDYGPNGWRRYELRSAA